LEGREVVFVTPPQPSPKEREPEPADFKSFLNLEVLALPNYKSLQFECAGTLLRRAGRLSPCQSA